MRFLTRKEPPQKPSYKPPSKTLFNAKAALFISRIHFRPSFVQFNKNDFDF